MTNQNSLFDDHQAPMPEPHKGNLVAQVKAHASSPLQVEFAKLLEKIEAGGQRLQELDHLNSQYRAKFAQILPPLEAEHQAMIRKMVLFLHERLQRPDSGKRKSLTANNRQSIARVIVSLVQDAQLQGDAQMRSIHDLYSDASIEETEAANREVMREMLGDLGLELPDSAAGSSAEDLVHAALSALQERAAKEEQAHAQRKAKRDEKRSAKAQADSQAKPKLAPKQQAAQDAQSALKNIYRQLARQLHPDRATDDAQRARNHDLMSQANTAYDRQDLLTLLKLQLKAEQIDASAMSTVPQDTLKNWVALLREQAKDLIRESSELEMHMAQEFGVPSQYSLTAGILENALRSAVDGFNDVLAVMRRDLEFVQTDVGLKRWAKTNNQHLDRNAQILDDDLRDAMAFQQMMRDISRQPRKRKR